MSRKANPSAVGAFALLTLVVLVTAILLFGGGTFLAPSHKYTLFFGSSVKGLRVGAPVTLRGDQIGQVVEVRPLVNTETEKIDIKVVVDLPDDDQIQIVGEGRLADLTEKEAIDFLVNEKGMRAKLSLQSPITGQLFVDLDFHPDKPKRIKDTPTRYPQLPTIETGLQQLMRSLQELPIQEIVQKVQNTLDAITALATSPKLPETLDYIHGAAAEARKLAANLNTRVDQLSADWLTTTGTARSTLVQVEKTFALEEGRPGEIADGLLDVEKELAAALRAVRNAASATAKTARRFEGVAVAVDSLIAEDSPTRAELESLIAELAEAARSVRLLADYLERHPEAFIQGKQ